MVIVQFGKGPENRVTLPDVGVVQDRLGRLFPAFLNPPTEGLQRQIFEAGRFSAQTEDPIDGPKELLRRQHEALLEYRKRDAARAAVNAGMSNVEFAGLYHLGRSLYRKNQRRARAQG